MTRRFWRSLLLPAAALACLLGACTTTTPKGREAPAALRDARLLPIYTAGGALIDLDTLTARCAQAQAVLIGEVHGHPQGLDFAATLWDGILARTDRAALSMEFFERDQQAALDDYLAGVTDEPTFKKASGRSEGNFPPGHRRLIEAAKAAGRPVVAANAPRRYVRLARTDGYDRLAALTPEQKRLFDLPAEMPSADYHDRFLKQMEAMPGSAPHGAGPAPATAPEEDPLEGIYRSQVLWDSTMAASIDRAIASGLAPVLHIVGAFHVASDGGTPQLLRKRRPDASIITVAIVAKDPPRATSPSPEDLALADYIVYVGESTAKDGR